MFHLINLSKKSSLKLLLSQIHLKSLKIQSFITSSAFLSPNLSKKPPFFRQPFRTTKSPSLCSKAAALLPFGGFCSDRASPRAVAAARAALTDYLHSTRGIHFTDAEHIGNHSPTFLRRLLGKVRDAEDVGRALARFFRYNPINEFEPFFESLGLPPLELAPLLPRDLMFLSDDAQMLNAYRTLCNYGISRGKIGRIYKEASEVFRCDAGVLASRLCAYEELGLSKSCIIKLVSSSPGLLIGGLNEEFVRLLEELEGVGIKKDWIGRNVCDKDVYDWGKMVVLLQFFHELGFTKQELGNLFQKYPEFLLKNSGKMTFSLFGLLVKLGGKREDISSLVSQFPQVEIGRFMKNLRGGLQFLIEIEMDQEDIQRIFCTHAVILGLRALKRPNSIFTDLNVGKKRLCKIVKEDPHLLKSYALGSKLSPLPNSGDDERSLMQKRKFLMRLGFAQDSKEMNKAITVFRGKGDELQERYDFLVNSGLDPSDVSNMSKMAPHVLNQKIDVLKSKIDFLVNGLGYPINSLVAFPSYMSYTVERVKLRFLMYNWLKDRGKAKPDLALSSILACSDKAFSKRFISHHPEGHKVWENFKKAIYSS